MVRNFIIIFINPNQLRSYGTMVWDNPFDSNREICVETEDGKTIDLLANGTDIRPDQRVPNEHELQSLPHVHLTSKFQWNPDTAQIGEVRDDAFKANYIACQYKYLVDTEKGDYQYQDMKAKGINTSLNQLISIPFSLKDEAAIMQQCHTSCN